MLACGLSTGGHAQDFLSVTGVTVDAETRAPLPFVQVGYEHALLGTISDEAGRFRLRVPATFADSLLTFRRLSYATYTERTGALTGDTVALAADPTLLDEVEVRPFAPVEYLRRAVAKFPDNYPDAPFNTFSYFRQDIFENGRALRRTEALLESWHPAGVPTDTARTRLLQARQTERLDEMTFMGRERERRERRGDTTVRDNRFEAADVANFFAGPGLVASLDITRRKPYFLQPEYFDEYAYTFGPSVRYDGRDVLVINFRTRGRIERMASQGKVYLDATTDAVVMIESRVDVRLPLYTRPLLLLAGIGMENPTFTVAFQYREVEGRWYPAGAHLDTRIDVERKRLWHANDQSQFDLRLRYEVVETQRPGAPIPRADWYDSQRPIMEQAPPPAPARWRRFGVDATP